MSNSTHIKADEWHGGDAKKPYFRDSLPTVDQSGKRRWIYPKQPSGRLYRLRWVVAILLLFFIFSAPFIRLGGEPFMLLDVLQRKFILFGQVFWPQDFHLLVLSIIAFIVFIILFTVIYGRIFCGWICPQTIFMEFVFRQIEHLFEGDAQKRKKRDDGVMDLEKIARKTLKHFAFICVALLISHLILVYIVGSDKLWHMISAGPRAHITPFLIMLALSSIMYFIYASFREQVCIILCPYGRLQGVLLDEKSIVVAYDHLRGEPRGKYASSEVSADHEKGDCIDCHNCVAVCPTGIDIRNGTQLECIHCTACIDACNQVMDRVKKPRGLIRYDSEKGIYTGRKTVLNGRILAYSAILGLLLTAITILFATRAAIEATILRIPGTLFQEYGPEHYSNIYKVQLVNKTREDIPISLRVTSHPAEIVFLGDEIQTIDNKIKEANFLIIMPKKEVTSSSLDIKIGLYSGDKLLTNYQTNFLGPYKNLGKP